MFQEQILEESNRFIAEQQAVNEKESITSHEDEPMDVATYIQRLQGSNILDNVYAKSVILEGELFSAEMQAAAGKNNSKKLQSAFNNFQNILKALVMKKRCLLDPNDKLQKQTCFQEHVVLNKFQLYCSLFLLNN